MTPKELAEIKEGLQTGYEKLHPGTAITQAERNFWTGALSGYGMRLLEELEKATRLERERCAAICREIAERATEMMREAQRSSGTECPGFNQYLGEAEGAELCAQRIEGED